MTDDGFKDHFSAVAGDYAAARPDYPQALFDWIASVAPSRALCWEAGCGSGQATRSLAVSFDQVFATDPSAAQVARAPTLPNATFKVEPAEHCSLDDGIADAVCVAQALHWFERDAFFAECTRVLKPGGVLVAWGYQDIVVPGVIAEANAELQREIKPYWPPERADIDAAYADYRWPFEAVAAPGMVLEAEWPLPRLLAYFSSYSASKRYREAAGVDPVASRAKVFEQAWGEPSATRRVQWPLFVHGRRKSPR